MISFPFETNGKLMVLGVPILKHFRVFSSKTTIPIEAKFHVEPSWGGGTKVCSGGSGSHDQNDCRAHIW